MWSNMSFIWRGPWDPWKLHWGSRSLNSPWSPTLWHAWDLLRHLAYLKFLPTHCKSAWWYQMISRSIRTPSRVDILEIRQLACTGILARWKQTTLMGSVYGDRCKRNCSFDRCLSAVRNSADFLRERGHIWIFARRSHHLIKFTETCCWSLKAFYLSHKPDIQVNLE